MRKLIITIFMVGVVFTSCDDRLEDLNKPITDPETVTAETLFANGIRQMFDMMVETDVNANVFRLYAQYWAQTTYPDESQFNMVGRRIPDNFWLNGYRDVLMDLERARLTIEETWEELVVPEDVKDNQLALIDISKVYVFSVLVDAFGAVPFTEALNPEILSPNYDAGADVYDGLIVTLDDAIGTLDASIAEAAGNNEVAEAFSASQDLVYSGDLLGWKNFANSLKLKIALTIADVNPTKAGAMVSEAIDNGLIASNAENASITYFASSPNTNPMWKDLVQSGRADYVIANTIVDQMNDLADPRLFVYGTPATFQYPTDDDGNKLDSVLTQSESLFLIYKDVDGKDSIVYESTPFTVLASAADKNLRLFSGGTYGDNNTYSRKSHVGDLFHQPDLEGLILDYAEVQFMLAEANERGFTTPMPAEEHYNAGITASMEYWDMSDADIADYLASPDVDYATAAGDWKQKIGTQAWLAFFNRGFEGWSLWRRLDFAGFNAPPDMTLDDIPNRLIFPVEEYTLNPSNLQEAIDMIGGDDDAAVKVFWDMN